LRVLDGAVAAFCAVGGVEPQSETVWRQADKYHVPRLCYINKMDRSGADFFEAVRQIKDILGSNPCPIQIPLGAEEKFKGIVDLVTMKAYCWHDETMGAEYETSDIPAEFVEEAEEWRDKMLETVSEFDDVLMEKYFADPSTITEDEIRAAIRIGTLSMKIYPMVCGSSFKNKGVQTLLDAVCAYLPSPLDSPNITGHDPENPEKEIVRKPESGEPLTALAFKIATDPYVGRLCFFRVYSGVLKAGSYVYNTRSGKKERISRLFQMHSNKQNPVEQIGCGDIGAGIGFKDIRTGDTLCDEKSPILLESMEFPDPVIGVAVEPKTQKDMDKMSLALQKLAEEDPTFRIESNQETGQTVINGMGELHLEIIVERLRREFHVECNQGRPKVSYKEAITIPVELREVYKKQSGGRGKFADIIVRIEPADAGFEGRLQFVDEVKGGNVPKEFIPSVQKGFEKAMTNGVLAGYQLDKLKVTLLDGSYHTVDSDQLSFEICAIQAFRSAAEKAGPVLLEPIMKIEVVTPEENMGDVIGDLNKRRGQIEGMEASRAGARIVKSKVPLAETFGYVTALRTITSGRATSSMQFSHFAQVSSNIAIQVLNEVQGRVDLVK
jgi:elongation factor G